jgi:hypothetical protein
VGTATPLEHTTQALLYYGDGRKQPAFETTPATTPQVIASRLSSLSEGLTHSRRSAAPRCTHCPCLFGQGVSSRGHGGDYGLDLLEVALEPTGQLQTGITDSQVSCCGAISGVGESTANVVARSAKARACVARIVKGVEDSFY